MTEDKKLEELKMTAHPFMQLYEYIYGKMGFVEGNEARTSATATVFISTKDEWKSIEYERKQEARKRPIMEQVIDLVKNAPAPAPDFKTAFDMKQEAKPQPTGLPEPPKAQPPKTEPPKTDEPNANMFGTDRWGKAWPTSLVCLNLVPSKDDPKKFEFCNGLAQVHRSQKTQDIFAICPKCNHFLKHDGKPGKLAQPQE